jgi:hypothetical chaperone protein
VRPIGLDFGTTNSAIAVAESSGEVRLARYRGNVTTFRSILYFERDEARAQTQVFAGPEAISRYLAGDGTGRLIQSIKSHLASRLFERTSIFGRAWELPDLLSALLERLFREAEADLGELPRRRAVVGRPVHFASAESDADETLALERLRASLARVGIEEPIFEPEPLAAAHAYERTLDHDETVLVADFGGGTSDFCLLSLGPSRHRGNARAVLATDGVGLAGDAFDGEVVTRAIAPSLGLGSRYRARMSVGGGPETLEVPTWIYSKLRRWHHLSLLKSRETLSLLDDLRKQSLEPEKLLALIHVIEADLGFHLYRTVEQTKVTLSREESSSLRYDDAPLHLDVRVAREDFDRWIVPPLEGITAALDRTLVKAGATPRDVDAVFMTGGTSLVPAVRQAFAARFGESKLRGGEELVSVALGLALRAAEL